MDFCDLWAYFSQRTLLDAFHKSSFFMWVRRAHVSELIYCTVHFISDLRDCLVKEQGCGIVNVVSAPLLSLLFQCVMSLLLGKFCCKFCPHVIIFLCLCHNCLRFLLNCGDVLHWLSLGCVGWDRRFWHGRLGRRCLSLVHQYFLASVLQCGIPGSRLPFEDRLSTLQCLSLRFHSACRFYPWSPSLICLDWDGDPPGRSGPLLQCHSWRPLWVDLLGVPWFVDVSHLWTYLVHRPHFWRGSTIFVLSCMVYYDEAKSVSFYQVQMGSGPGKSDSYRSRWRGSRWFGLIDSDDEYMNKAMPWWPKRSCHQHPT